jgi:hypothetical protein
VDQKRVEKRLSLGFEDVMVMRLHQWTCCLQMFFMARKRDGGREL